MEWSLSNYVTLQDQGIFLLRIVIACLCGGAIGIERTLRQKDAGFRTHVIVALGSALLMVVSKYGFFDIALDEFMRADGSRVASNIITGISFLGAGMIFVRGANIRGLTTAAGIWATAAVGMAVGSGLYLVGIVTTVVIVLIQILFHTFLIGYDKVLANDNNNEIIVRLSNRPEAVNLLKKQLAEKHVSILSTKVELNSDETMTLVLSARFEHDLGFDDTLEIQQNNPDITSIVI